VSTIAALTTLLSLGLSAVLAAADNFASTWLPASDARVTRVGHWDWNSHRYAAESALETTEDGAALEFSFRGRALVLALDTLTPPNNYGPPELGAIEVFVDGAKTMTVRPRDAASEVTIVRAPDEVARTVRLVHRQESAGAGARIRGFRLVPGVSGDLAFLVNGEKNAALIDARAILTRHGHVVRDALVRNWLTGDCRLAGLPPGGGYVLELRSSGWKTFRQDDISVEGGRETVLAPVYLVRERDVPQDAFTFPTFGYAAVRQPGGTFRARFEGHRAEIRSVRIVSRHGPAVISRPCQFREDKAAAFYYHREGDVSIPADTPPGTYDLEVTMGDQRRTHALVSPRAVAVVATFAREPVFVSWGHLDTWGQYQAEYVSRLVEIANVLAPDMVLVSNEANPAYAAGALHGLQMPFVINFGNHRGPEGGPWFGQAVGAVDFGEAFTVVNFGNAWDQGTAEAEALLATRTPTRLRIINGFESNAPLEFLDRHRVALIHYAHGPGPAVAKLGATPTVRVGKSSSESFRVIRFKSGQPESYTYRGHATAPYPFPRDARAPVGVTYEPANDGTQRHVRAHFWNEFEESFRDARAVFVLPRGKYAATGARIEQAIDSDDANFTVVTARFDLSAKTSGQISVLPADR
jgi:hypothetical protein